ncbi:GH32 C-terminal domain-containing protein [Nonomuraea sp. NPDC005650]|uniref:GH32 C-terminal domain-containing protein n=1 Tax=Nonomuraea sp. NPDC005650 TaxID=3157045 RepID=UPI0033BD47F2
MPPALAGDPADYPEYPYPTSDEGAYDEPHRGQFHFSPRSGWMNDPNAPLYYKGTYHLFFQHNPHGLGWDTMHWGHAASPDLVHWTQRPVALEPVQARRTISASTPLAGVAGDTYEVIAEFDVAGATASEFGLLLHTRADGGYDRKVAYDRAGQTLYGAPLAPERGRVRMRVLVDRGQLEIFGNDGRLFYSDNVDFSAAPGSRGVAVYAAGGRVKLVSLKYHDLVRTWPPSTSGTNPGSNIAGPWRPVGGAWTSLADGKTGTALSGGNAFYLSGRTGTDFTYEGDLRPDRPGAAAALTFRAGVDLATHYTANVDTVGFVRLWWPGAVLADFRTAITPGTSYHLKVVANGPRIRVYFGGGAEPVIDVTDTATGGGYFGLNVWNGTGTIRAATVT